MPKTQAGAGHSSSVKFSIFVGLKYATGRALGHTHTCIWAFCFFEVLAHVYSLAPVRMPSATVGKRRSSVTSCSFGLSAGTELAG